MTWALWAAFMAIEVPLMLTPGPAVLFVLSQGLRHGGRHSLWANLGILSGNACYFALSAAWVEAVQLLSHPLFVVIKWCGAGYLVYLGLRMVLWPGHLASPGPDAERRSGWAVLRQGFVLQVSNPKALLFFAAILPPFINTAGNVPLQLAILAVSSIATEFVILAAYGLAAGRLSGWARRPAVARATDQVAGCLLIGAGVSLGLISGD